MLPIRRGGDELIDNFSLVPLVEASRIILFGPNMNNNAFNRIKWDNLFFGQVISFLILLSLSSSFVCRLYSTPCAPPKFAAKDQCILLPLHIIS
mmetsp:Transcript_23399/g.35446  ORF Transcript_23399/g.35446 Transcript_23399/m.35446 type:complete len:94 (+) Transcript_23399:920-1201(+)